MDCSHAMDVALSSEARAGCAPGRFYLVMDLAPGVSLRSTLKGRAESPLSMTNLRNDEFSSALRTKVAEDLLTCVNLLGIYQDDPGKGDLPVILHRDLKPDNFHVAATGSTAADLAIDLTMLDLGLALPLVAEYTFHDLDGKKDKERVPGGGPNDWKWTTASSVPSKLRGKRANAPEFLVHEDDALALEGYYWVCRAWSCTNTIQFKCRSMFGGASWEDRDDRCQVSLAELKDPATGSGVYNVNQKKLVGTLIRNPADPWGRVSAPGGQLAHSGPFYQYGYPTAPPAVCFTSVQAEKSPAHVSGFDVFSVGAVDYMMWCVNYHFSKDFDWCEQRLMNYIFEYENTRVGGSDGSAFDQRKPETWPVGSFVTVTLDRATYAHGFPGSSRDWRFLGMSGSKCKLVATRQNSAQMTKRIVNDEGCRHVTLGFPTGETFRGFRTKSPTGESVTDLWKEVNQFDKEHSKVPGALQDGSARPSAADLLSGLVTVQVNPLGRESAREDGRGRESTMATGRGSTAPYSYRASHATGAFGRQHGNAPNSRAGSTQTRPNYNRVSKTGYRQDGTAFVELS